MMKPGHDPLEDGLVEVGGADQRDERRGRLRRRLDVEPDHEAAAVGVQPSRRTSSTRRASWSASRRGAARPEARVDRLTPAGSRRRRCRRGGLLRRAAAGGEREHADGDERERRDSSTWRDGCSGALDERLRDLDLVRVPRQRRRVVEAACRAATASVRRPRARRASRLRVARRRRRRAGTPSACAPSPSGRPTRRSREARLESISSPGSSVVVRRSSSVGSR